MARLLSVNVGRPREIAWRGKTLQVRVEGASAGIGVSLYSAAGRDEHALAVLGFGLGTLQQILIQPDDFAVGLLIALAFGKLVTTPLTVYSGGSDGVFGPALIVGGRGVVRSDCSFSRSVRSGSPHRLRSCWSEWPVSLLRPPRPCSRRWRSCAN